MKNIAVVATLLIASQAHAVKFKRGSMNDPFFFNVIAKTELLSKFSSLPLSGKLKDDRLGWSENFWPSNKGGIAYRWNHPNPTPFDYKLHTKEELLKMSEEDIGKLSPAELYDISQGDYKYSLTKAVLKTYKKDDLWWEGICHGWALAASHFAEPAKVEITNKDGIVVPFGSSDVKGLLSMHEAFNSKGNYAQVGARCSTVGKVPGEAFPEDGDVPEPSEKDANAPACSDTNAGAFHIVLSNMLGRLSLGFVADVDRFNDVWNQPIIGYESEVVESVAPSAIERSEGIAKKVRVKTKFSYGDELEFFTEELAKEGVIGFVTKEPVTGTPAQTIGVKDYEYILELDAQDQIIGGEWISKTRPDFIWAKNPDAKFSSSPGNGTGFGLLFRKLFRPKYPLEGLNQIYKPITR